MRHLGSIVLSLVLAAITYLLTGIGLVKMAEAMFRHGTSKYTALGAALLALLVAGLLYSVLTLARLSPLGPVLSGLALFSITMWAIFATGSFQRTMPNSVLGVSGAPLVPAGGIAALLAVPLLATIVSPRRWRRYANQGATVAAYSAAPAYSPYPQSAAPNYGPPYYGSDTPVTPSYGEQPTLRDPDATRPLNQ
jgi:hypothetical protein